MKDRQGKWKEEKERVSVSGNYLWDLKAHRQKQIGKETSNKNDESDRERRQRAEQ